MSTIAYREEMKMKVTFGIWGFVIGAFMAMIIGFQLGGWTTSSTTQQITKDAVLMSQVASQAAICVTQFVKDPKYNEHIAALQKIDGYERQKFIEKGEWDKMPGQKEATSGVAEACAVGLGTLIKK